MNKEKIYFSLFIYPISKFLLSLLRSEKIKCGKILISIFDKEDWREQQKRAFNVSIDLLKNTFPEKYLSMVYHNINRIYIERMDDCISEYCLTPKKMLILYYRAGYTDNERYLSSLLVRCAYEIENLELPENERNNIGQLVQLDFLSNFSGQDIEFFRDRLFTLASAT